MEEMKKTVQEISINGVSYVPKGSDNKMAECFEGLPYVIVRTYSAGVFAGYLKSRAGQEVVVLKARRLWYWDGAASLSQLAVDGVKKPKTCKFPCEVPSIELLNAIEIIPCSEKARLSIASVGVWQE